MTLVQGPGHLQPCKTLCTVVSVPLCTWQDTVLETVYWHQFLKWKLISYHKLILCLSDKKNIQNRHQKKNVFWVGPVSEISFEESDISLNTAHALTWVGFGGQSLEVHRCRSVPIWCAAAARWCWGSGKQSLFPAKDRLNSSTRTRRKATIKPTSPLRLPEKLFPQRFSSKSGNNSPFSFGPAVPATN